MTAQTDLRRRLRAQPEPEGGFMLVPREPTAQMLKAASEMSWDPGATITAKHIYRAMIYAAPVASAPPVSVGAREAIARIIHAWPFETLEKSPPPWSNDRAQAEAYAAQALAKADQIIALLAPQDEGEQT